MTDRIQEDHENAARLARGISQIEGLSIDLDRVQTNIVYFDLLSEALDCDEILVRLTSRGVKILRTGPRRFRAVTHYGIRAEDIDRAVSVLADVTTSL
jgi:threonine aldolase